MIFNRFFDPIIGSLIHNSINLVMFPFYNWHLSSSQSLKLIEDLFCDTLLPNIGSFDSKIELVDDYFLQCMTESAIVDFYEEAKTTIRLEHDNIVKVRKSQNHSFHTNNSSKKSVSIYFKVFKLGKKSNFE